MTSARLFVPRIRTKVGQIESVSSDAPPEALDSIGKWIVELYVTDIARRKIETINRSNEETGKCQLFVMNPSGVYFNPTPYSEQPKPGHWSWPPRS